MRIDSLLTPEMDVVALVPTATVLEATKLMVGTRRGSVLIRVNGDPPQGIFTERDLMVRVVARGRSPRNVRLEEVMTTDLFTTTPCQKVTTVRRAMRERHIRHVPVVQDGTVLTVLSMRDLLRADFEEIRDDAQALQRYIQGEGI
jgi:signal-transduction protein with cAMP-binding, CBS, and nucleotidyltransferase domain